MQNDCGHVALFFQWRPRRPDRLPTTPRGPRSHGDCCAQQRPEWVGYLHLFTHTLCLTVCVETVF